MKIMIFLLALLFAQITYANSKLSHLFEDQFLDIYIEGKCGQNILEFIRVARDKKIDLKNAKILTLTNKGFSTFGLLNVEYARSSGKLNPDYPHLSDFRNLPGERNWYHHVILEQDGLIYDFDYGNEPIVETTEQYFEKMFLNDLRKSEGGEFYVGRDEKLKTYQIEIQDALKTLQARDQRVSSTVEKTLRMGAFLN